MFRLPTRNVVTSPDHAGIVMINRRSIILGAAMLAFTAGTASAQD
jgi:hypothetical protein